MTIARRPQTQKRIITFDGMPADVVAKITRLAHSTPMDDATAKRIAAVLYDYKDAPEEQERVAA